MSENTKLYIELENGHFTGVTSPTPSAFDDIDVSVVNHTVSAIDADPTPLNICHLDMVDVDIDMREDDETITVSMGAIEVAETAWAQKVVEESMDDNPDDADAAGEEDQAIAT